MKNKIEKNIIKAEDYNKICNVIYPLVENINITLDSKVNIGHSCVLINYFAKKIIDLYFKNLNCTLHFGNVWYSLENNAVLNLVKGSYNHGSIEIDKGIGHCFLFINHQENTYLIDFTSFAFNKTMENIIGYSFQMKKRMFIKNIIEKKEYHIQLKPLMGDFSFEITPENELQRNQQINYLENLLFIQDYVIISQDWYKSLKPEIGVKDNKGNRNKLYLGKNNVKAYW